MNFLIMAPVESNHAAKIIEAFLTPEKIHLWWWFLYPIYPTYPTNGITVMRFIDITRCLFDQLPCNLSLSLMLFGSQVCESFSEADNKLNKPGECGHSTISAVTLMFIMGQMT
ncbi:unnamed protein product [Clavelina lepadiformis]|uniref:Uncharacterized protein n=1 Tax=Clavelina lepadiformis TaxID=159417 RepID=A0ABP0GAL4_CLALP